MRASLLFSLSALIAVLNANPSRAQSNPQRKAISKLVHVFVALADNSHQGIVPVPTTLGNGDDPRRNLYWGASFGVRTFFERSKDWVLIGVPGAVNHSVIQRVVFRNDSSGTILVADAYRGSEIRAAIDDFLAEAAGERPLFEFEETMGKQVRIDAKADLVVYVGHDGLMDFSLEKSFPNAGGAVRQAIVLACATKQYFKGALKQTGATPLLWTTNLMAPEAYTLKAALDGWIAGETDEQIRQRAAAAYAQYQKISKSAALKLFATGW